MSETYTRSGSSTVNSRSSRFGHRQGMTTVRGHFEFLLRPNRHLRQLHNRRRFGSSAGDSRLSDFLRHPPGAIAPFREDMSLLNHRNQAFVRFLPTRFDHFSPGIITATTHVITSYSIHYTKLYDGYGTGIVNIFWKGKGKMNQEHYDILKNQGVMAWNKWRDENPDIKPDLRGADLSGADIRNVNLMGANLSGAKLRDARLT